jgi:hypothetical protein
MLRAGEHLKTLEAEWQAFLDEDPSPYTFVGEFDPESGWHVVRLRIRKDPPLRLSVIVGDAVHNLRSALDHLVWKLVEENGAVPGEWNHFPVHKTWDAWTDKVVMRQRKGSNHALAGLDPIGEPWAFIESVQPYRRAKPDYAPLAVLTWLWNVDKHRTLHGQYVSLEPVQGELDFRWRADAGQPLAIEATLAAWDTLEDGAEVARLQFARPGPLDPQVEMDTQLALSITFGDAETPTRHVTIEKIAEYVAPIMHRSESFFE